jgi:hypothetical protein
MIDILVENFEITISALLRRRVAPSEPGNDCYEKQKETPKSEKYEHRTLLCGVEIPLEVQPFNATVGLSRDQRQINQPEFARKICDLVRRSCFRIGGRSLIAEADEKR